MVSETSKSNVPERWYAMEIYKVGYDSNDAYTSYLSMGKPSQLSREQVNQIKKQNDGSPFFRRIVQVKPGSPFFHQVDLRENDVFLFSLVKL